MSFVFIRLYSYLFKTGTVSLFLISSYFPKRHKLTQDVSESGADRKSTQILVCFWISIYRIFQSWSFWCVTDRGFHLNLPWKVIELNKHFCEYLLYIWLCFEGVSYEAGFVPALEEFKFNWTREATIVKPRIYFWVFEVTFLASVFLCIMAKRVC